MMEQEEEDKTEEPSPAVVVVPVPEQELMTGKAVEQVLAAMLKVKGRRVLLTMQTIVWAGAERSTQMLTPQIKLALLMAAWASTNLVTRSTSAPVSLSGGGRPTWCGSLATRSTPRKTSMPMKRRGC